MDKKLLVLDIDETLFHCIYPQEISNAIKNGYMEDRDDYDFTLCSMPAIERPYVHKFLHWAFQEFDVGIWTSATDDYAEDFVEKLLRDPQHGEPVFVYSRENCTKATIYEPWGSGQFEYVKDLKKLKKFGYPLEHTIAVDDTPAKLKRQYGNLVRMVPFYGDKGDTELLKLMDYLDYLKTVTNVRDIDKRGWNVDK